MSAAYSMRGTAMERYSCCVYFTLIPWDTHASLLNCIIQSCPLAREAMHCPFQFNLLSTITPKNLAVSFDGMHCSPRMSAHHGIGTFFLGFNWCRMSFLEMSSSWNFSTPNSQLWFFAHSSMPPVQFIMRHNFSWVSIKSFPVTIITISSTKRRIHSPILMVGISSKSKL